MTTQALYDSVHTIRLYGKLGARFGRVHRMAVSCAAEAIRALSSQLKGFEAFLIASKDCGLAYSVFYGKQNLAVDDIHAPHGNRDIRIAPMIIGAKNGGIFQIILGTLLVVAATLIGGPAAGAMALKIAAAFTSMGYAMIIGGVVQLLTPAPKGRSSKDKPENESSYAFNGPINTQAQGNPVPVLYGELIVGSAVASAGINVKDHTYVPAANAGGTGGGSSVWMQLYHAATGETP